MKFKAFRERLMLWHLYENNREMPWKKENDPYKVWLSEVILQQTRVEQGTGYYEKFLHAYPEIQMLAGAKDEDVFKLWEGLGYYNRCKNLLTTARYISYKLNGKFPCDHHSLLSLKGVGNYTASAISSFCFNLPHAVVDGNVMRVLSRVFGIYTPIDTSEGKKLFYTLAGKTLDKKNPALYNQAIMDFGATVCTPALPKCQECLLSNICIAYKTKMVNKLPVKEKQLNKRLRWFTYFVFTVDDKKFIRKRTGKDIWENLYEFYLVETPRQPNWSMNTTKEWLHENLKIKNATVQYIIPANAQQLTHQLIKGYFIEVVSPSALLKALKGDWLTPADMQKLAFPKFINQYFKKKFQKKHLLFE